jgi:hypothetical protein
LLTARRFQRFVESWIACLPWRAASCADGQATDNTKRRGCTASGVALFAVCLAGCIWTKGQARHSGEKRKRDKMKNAR